MEHTNHDGLIRLNCSKVTIEYLNLEPIRIGNKGYKLITYRVTCGKDVCSLFWVNAKPNFDRPSQNLAQLEWVFDDISPCKILVRHKLCCPSNWLCHIEYYMNYNKICYYGTYFLLINFMVITIDCTFVAFENC